ncbi:hypothetical protein PR202_gb28437 [Eleusine coracana subsp. coracana]|uniref:Uncharacterized protein n=1 Tax=Eleusine coracana subsp. coracana TaxID=191504 RepID=A0AAV5FWD7_ELECO|nr:hypothetical protein PR202_gb28437 [Eleusine coracana subsp. coracana]
MAATPPPPSPSDKAAAVLLVPWAVTAKPAFEEESSEQQPLLPGLPDPSAQLCPLLASTASWPRRVPVMAPPGARRLLMAPPLCFPPFLSLYAVLDSTTTSASNSVSFAAYDTLSGRWEELPPPPLPSPPPQLWHPSFLSRRLPLQTVAASGRLVVVAGSTHALDPARWHDPRWCAAGAARGRVFVAGGVGAGYDAADARAGATWDPVASPSSSSGGWESLPALKDGRFSRDAAEAVCSGGKVCMVSLRTRGAKEGAVFDLQTGRWEDMPPGMMAGWTGPSSSDSGEETIYVVDEERGALIAYDWATDRWNTVVESDRLKGAAEITAGGGRVCVAVNGGEKVIVVDVTSSSKPPPPRKMMWEVSAPAGKRVVALHVLPRMTRASAE